MSENQTETVEAPESTVPDAPEPETVQSTGDPVKDAIIASIVDTIEKANASAAKIGAATTDTSKLDNEAISDPDTTDESLRKFQQWKEALLQKLEVETQKALAHAASLREAATTGEAFDLDAEKATHKVLAAKAKQARQFYLETMPGTTEDDLKGVPSLKNLRGGTSGGTGTGGKRPRVERISWKVSESDNWSAVEKEGKNAKGEAVTVTNFTLLAQALSQHFETKVEPKDLHSAAFDAAGTDDLNTLNGRVFDFHYTDGKVSAFVQIQPKVKEAKTESE